MKKALSIMFALMILFSGMHLSLATHFCGGEISAVRWSFTDEKASCGMECDNSDTQDYKVMAPECCQNNMAFYQVDNNYSPSHIQVDKPAYHLIQVFYLPENTDNVFSRTEKSLNTNIRPPGTFLASAVELTDICVFRI